MPYIFLDFTVNGPPAVDSDTDPFRAIAIDALVIDSAGSTLNAAHWDISPPVLPRSRKGKPYPGLPSDRVVEELLALRDAHHAPFLCWWGTYSQILLRLLSRDAGKAPILLEDVPVDLCVIKGGDVALAFRDRQVISRGKTPGGKGRPPTTNPDLIYRAVGGPDKDAPLVRKKAFIFWQMLQGKTADERILKMAGEEDEA